MNRHLFSIQLVGVFIAGSLTITNPGSPAADEPISCGTTYTVASGDTLTSLAARAYGNGRLALAIYDANTEILSDENSLLIGDQLLVPCLDRNWPQSLQGALEDETAGPVVGKLFEPTGTTAPAIAPRPPQMSTQPLRAVSASNFPPFSGEALAEGGLVTDLVRRAIGAADYDREVNVAFVNDWNSHLEVLLPSGNFDVSFPWSKPDCDGPENLTAVMRQRCETFTFSRPLVELTITYFGRADELPASTTPVETLVEKRVCHSSGAGFLDLERASPEAVLQNAPTADACFMRLMAGKTDLVALPQHQAEVVIRRIKFAGSVAEIDHLRTVHALYAIALKGRPAGETAIALIDRGLESLMISGDWFNVVAMHQKRDAVLW